MKNWKKITLAAILLVLAGGGWLWYDVSQKKVAKLNFIQWVQGNDGYIEEWEFNWIKKLPKFLQKPATEVFGETVKAVVIPDRDSYIYSGPKHKLSGLSPLTEFEEIVNIVIPYTSVTDLSPLAGLKDLEMLNISHTDVSDLSPLKELKKLKVVKIHKTKVDDLSVFENHPALYSLQLDDTPVSDISFVKTVPALESLAMGGSQVTDISAVSSLTKLRVLNIESTGVTDLTPAKNLKSLKFLIISRTEIRDLTPLKGLPLIELHAALCEFPDISVLKKINTLKLLDLERSKIDLNQLEEIKKALPECEVKYRKRVE